MRDHHTPLTLLPILLRVSWRPMTIEARTRAGFPRGLSQSSTVWAENGMSFPGSESIGTLGQWAKVVEVLGGRVVFARLPRSVVLAGLH
jgi:hypothetical protein